MYASSVRIVSATLAQRKVKIFLNARTERRITRNRHLRTRCQIKNPPEMKEHSCVQIVCYQRYLYRSSEIFFGGWRMDEIYIGNVWCWQACVLRHYVLGMVIVCCICCCRGTLVLYLFKCDLVLTVLAINFWMNVYAWVMWPQDVFFMYETLPYGTYIWCRYAGWHNKSVIKYEWDFMVVSRELTLYY